MICYEPIYLKKLDMLVNCGKCLNCISRKKREHGLRVMNEFENYKYKQFATITYNDLYIPINEHGQPSLVKKHAVDYIKRLNIAQKRHYRAEGIEAELKYYSGWEYSPEAERPHGHMVIASNTPIRFNAKTLWEYGNVEIEDLISNASVSYTVGYTHKKDGYNLYENREQPFHKFSKGIGRDWFEEAWKNNEVSIDKYYIETMQARQGIGTYYKYLLRKKYYTYDMDEVKLAVGKLRWKNFQEKVIENIVNQNKDLTAKQNKDDFKRWKSQYNARQWDEAKKYRFEELTYAIDRIKKTAPPEIVFEEISKEMKNFKSYHKVKQARREALQRFYMRVEKRKEIA